MKNYNIIDVYYDKQKHLYIIIMMDTKNHTHHITHPLRLRVGDVCQSDFNF